MEREITIRLEKSLEAPLKKAVEASLTEIKEKIQSHLFLKKLDQEFESKPIERVAIEDAGLFTEAIIKNSTNKNRIDPRKSTATYKKSTDSSTLEFSFSANESFRSTFEKEKDRIPFLINEMTDLNRNSAKQLFDKLTEEK